jgi:hypothetical protein
MIKLSEDEISFLEKIERKIKEQEEDKRKQQK